MRRRRSVQPVSGPRPPAPVKVGRSYYVEERAVFRDGVQKPRLVHRAFGHGS
ncbi:excisionase [Paraburkholderia franconis]|uniref:excisionase n=1 Tax=Paraburkholderia franconis TaxID=2654983 RepID=UPI002AB2E022|nr:excisionase [Paraburkholderia franconis]